MYSCARILLVYKEFRRIRCQNTQHNTCIFLASYKNKIVGTKNSLDHPWCIPSVISNTAGLLSLSACSLCLHLPHLCQNTSGLLSHPLFFLFFFLTKSCADYLICLSHFVLFWETSVWKSTLLQKHISSTMSPDKKPYS